jgi:hypothetical protein
MSLRKPLAASIMSAATQRRAILPFRHRFTLRVTHRVRSRELGTHVKPARIAIARSLNRLHRK